MRKRILNVSVFVFLLLLLITLFGCSSQPKPWNKTLVFDDFTFTSGTYKVDGKNVAVKDFGKLHNKIDWTKTAGEDFEAPTTAEATIELFKSELMKKLNVPKIQQLEFKFSSEAESKVTIGDKTYTVISDCSSYKIKLTEDEWGYATLYSEGTKGKYILSVMFDSEVLPPTGKHLSIYFKEGVDIGKNSAIDIDLQVIFKEKQ